MQMSSSEGRNSGLKPPTRLFRHMNDEWKGRDGNRTTEPFALT